jgi:hypothetical protein
MREARAWPEQRPLVQVLQQGQGQRQQGQLVPQALVLVQQVRVLLHCQLAVVRSMR